MPERTHVAVANMHDAAIDLPASTLTPASLAQREAPRIGIAARAASGEIREALGTARWLIVGPALWLLTQPRIMAILIRIVLEVAIWYAGPIKPALIAALPLLSGLLASARARAITADVLSLLERGRVSESAAGAIVALIDTRDPQATALIDPEDPPEPITP